MNHLTYQVTTVIEKDEYGYYAYCPQLPGCQSQGDSLEEIKANIQEAIKLYKWVCKINYTVAIGSRESGVVNRQKIRQF
jgi:predicted RNase H-like HicB family nuclease